jgi:hypothetical protein
MAHRFRDLTIAAATAAGLAVLLPFVDGVSAQTQAPYRAPRTADGKPNLAGIWQALNEGNWNIEPHAASDGPREYGALYAVPAGVGIVEGGALPYKPEALKKRQENVENRFKREARDGVRAIGADPEAACFMPGVPRANYMPYPFQIIQSTDKILIAYPFASASRLIYLKDIGESPLDSYMGWSEGHWEGETLVVDVTGLNEKTWFDRAGNWHSNQMHVVERFTAASPDIIDYEATIEDPEVFTRPWKMSFPLYRRKDKGIQFLEFKCVPFSEDFVYGHLRQQPTK